MATKLRWEYPPQEEMHTIQVNDINNIGVSGITELRPCQYGINEQGAIVKTLYCTRDGRFYVHYPDGWHEQKPCFNPGMQNHRGGSAYPKMRQFGNKLCHHIMAHAWLGPRPEGFEADHINGNKEDWSADNLQWVTTKENIRRATIMRKLRKMGIDPKIVYIRNLRGIYSLEEAPLEYFLDRLPEVFAGDTSALSVDAINLDVAKTLDETHDLTIHCEHCGVAMIEDTEEHHTCFGTLCDCCYGDLFG